MTPRCRSFRAWTMLFVTGLLCGCHVQIRRAPSEPTEPLALYDWAAPSPVQQLELDDTRLREGFGAVFVPAISDGDREPNVVILQRDEEVGRGPTGRRIQVPAGRTHVRVGSGSVSQTMDIVVDIRPGQTVMVPVQWGGLVVEVVDENNLPHRGSYELIRMSDREVLGLGFGADTLLGETLRTWLLEPGLYRIVRAGSTYRARTDFATVSIPEGGLVLFKLVEDPVTGDFRGAGVVTADELSSPMGMNRWTRRMVLGVNAGFTHSDGVVGISDQLTLSGDMFWDTLVTYEYGRNAFTGILEVEEGIIHVTPAEGEPLPLQKSRDRLRLDLIYTMLLTDWFGPYLSVGAVASLFPARVIATEDLTVRRIYSDGTERDQPVEAFNSFETSGFLGSVQLRQGIGINLRLLRRTAANIGLRIGAGFRQNLFHDSFVVEDLANSYETEYRELDGFNQTGIESVLTAKIRLLRFLTYVTEAEFFAGFPGYEGPVVLWNNTLSFRFTSFAALDYTFELSSQPSITDRLQLSQGVLLRLAWDIL